MAGAGTPHEIEMAVADSEPYQPSYFDLPIKPLDWIWDDGGTLKQLAAVTTGTVGLAVLETGTGDSVGLQWEATADETDSLILGMIVPGDYSDIGRGDDIMLDLWFRKRDTTGSATDNTDLAIIVALYAMGIGDSTSAAKTASHITRDGTTVANGTLPVKTAATTRASFTKFRYRWKSTGIAPYESIRFVVGLNEAVGTALSVDLLGGLIRYKRHLAVPRSEREI